MFGTVSFTPKRVNGRAGIETQSLGKPAARFPAAVATDSDLAIAVDRQQTALASTLDSVSTTMTVANAASIVAFNLLSIDSEIVKVTAAPTGNSVPIQRGFDGTTPALHLSGAAVTGYIDAYHHNTLVAEVEAIENALGTNLSKLPTSPFVISGAFVFTPQSPGGSLIAGANTITLSPVPTGVNGSDTGHYVSISGGTGAAEAALILGGSAVGGAPSGNLIIQCANTHSGAWTISTATVGIQEAICSLPSGGGEVIVNQSGALSANVSNAGKSFVQAVKLAGIVLTGAFKIFGQTGSGDGTTEQFSYVSPNNSFGTSGLVVRGVTPTLYDVTKPAYAAIEGNVSNFPIATLNPVQFSTNGVLGACNITSDITGNTNGNGILGLCTTASPVTPAVGVGAYANITANGCSAWGANITCSNQVSPSSSTGAHASTITGIEVDINAFGPGNVDAMTGVMIIGAASTIQPAQAQAISISPLGAAGGGAGQPMWTAGVYFNPGSCQTALDIRQANTGNSQSSQPIRFTATDASGNVYSASVTLIYNGTLMLTGGNAGAGHTYYGVAMQDGAGNQLFNFNNGSSWIQPLPVYASNTAAAAAGLSVGTLYKTSTGQVMQVF